jgi:hypothetical protein
MSQPLFNKFKNKENAEKLFALWKAIQDCKKNKNHFFQKNLLIKKEKILFETLTYFATSIFFLKLFFLKENGINFEEKRNIENCTILIILCSIVSFQMNWNQEFLQNIELFKEIFSKDNPEFKNFFRKKDFLQTIYFNFFPFLCMIGIDIKSIQNKTQKIKSDKIFKKSFGSFFIENKQIEFLHSSMKVFFFMDFGKYLKLLPISKSVFKIKSKKNASKFYFCNFIVLKNKKYNRMTLLSKKKTKILSLKILQNRQTFRLNEIIFIRRYIRIYN